MFNVNDRVKITDNSSRYRQFKGRVTGALAGGFYHVLLDGHGKLASLRFKGTQLGLSLTAAPTYAG